MPWQTMTMKTEIIAIHSMVNTMKGKRNKKGKKGERKEGRHKETKKEEKEKIKDK